MLPSLTSWLMMFSIQLYQVIYELHKGKFLFLIPDYVYSFFYFLFLIFIFFAGKTIVQKEAKLKSLEIIWLIISLGGTGVILNAISNWVKNIYISNYSSILWYNLDKHIGILTNAYFFIALFFIFRQLILFRYTKFKQFAWNFLEYLILASFLFVFNRYIPIPYTFLATFFFISILFILYLSIHTEWVAYLNFKEKFLGVFFLTVILIIELSYIFLIDIKFASGSFFDITENLHLDLIYFFGLLYTFFCILVLLFNLPTSSLYELRQLERKAINDINQLILKSKYNFEEVYKILIHYGILCAKADFGWINLYESEKNKKIIHVSGINENNINYVQPFIDKYWSLKKTKNFFIDDVSRLTFFTAHSNEIQSFFAIKISTTNKEYGEMVLGWKHKNAFDIELHSFLSIISEQAAIAIENKELFSKSISLERYQEQIKIAKDFQDRVLPQVKSIEDFEIHAINHEADEVGGDYFEIYQDENYINIIIADVAGKGTTAAFYMAELKGMLQILFSLNLNPLIFVQKLNAALSNCLAPNLFVTVNFVKINKKTKKCQFLRAGHTPLLHFKATENKVLEYRPKGIGLGVLRKSLSEKNFDIYEFPLQPNDILMFFTDGIIEARDDFNKELGVEMLKDWLKNFASLSAIEINYSILEQMMAFTNEKKIEDDYTILTLVVK